MSENKLKKIVIPTESTARNRRVYSQIRCHRKNQHVQQAVRPLCLYHFTHILPYIKLEQTNVSYTILY